LVHIIVTSHATMTLSRKSLDEPEEIVRESLQEKCQRSRELKSALEMEKRFSPESGDAKMVKNCG